MVDVSGVLKRLPTREDLLGAVNRVPAAKDAVSPFVLGDSVGSVVTAVADARYAGMSAAVLYLPLPESQGAARLVHMQTIEALSDDDLSDGNDLVVDPVALGLGRSAPATVRSEVAAVCGAAAGVGMYVTFTGVPHDLVEEVLAIRADLAGEFPDLGVTIGANLRRSEGDCLDLAASGARVRLLKKQESEPVRVALTNPHDIDRAYVRCLRLLMSTGARTIVATHDSRLIEIASALAERAGREPGHYSYQFRRGVITQRAAELVAAGSSVGVLVAFGPDWARYLSTRIALTPSSVTSAVRAATSGGSGR